MIKLIWKKFNSNIRFRFKIEFNIWLEEKRKGIIVQSAFNELLGPGLRNEFTEAYKQEIEEMVYFSRKRPT